MAKMNSKNGRGHKRPGQKNNPSNNSSSSIGSKTTEARSTNDPKWYGSDPSLLRDAASYPFSTAIGNRLHLTTAPAYNKAEDSDTIPGIMAIKTAPSCGLSRDANSPLNVAAVSMYAYVRHENSGHSNYDSPDLMLYCLAMSSVYSFINWCMRLYGLAMTYSQRNRYLPRYLVECQGVDFDNLVNNLANFRFWINVMISKASALYVPATMSYFSRAAFLYQNVYCEGSSIKDQLYLYQPAGFYKFGLDSNSQAGNLEYTPLPASMDVDDIIAYGNAMLAAIVPDEDFNIMSGDILRAYKGDVIKLVPLPELYQVVPIYDILVLTQMKNATVVNVTAASLNVSHSSDAAYLMASPKVEKTITGTATNSGESDVKEVIAGDRIVTIESDEVTPEVMMEITRMVIGYGGEEAEGKHLYLNPGTEIATDCAYYKINPYDGSTEPALLTYSLPYVIVYGDGSTTWAPTDDDFFNFVQRLSARTHFKYAPMTNIVYHEANKGKIMGRLYDVDNYTVLSNYDISKLHEAATMNMLAVPSVAKVTKV